MKASWKNQQEIDPKQWDKLVESTTGSSPYAYFFYLDATAIEWEAYIAEDYSFAIPVGVVKKGGLARVYPPLFQGFIEPIGKMSAFDFKEFENSLLKRYKKGDLLSKAPVLHTVARTTYSYQELDSSVFKLKSLAKRMINRFVKEDYTVKTGVDSRELTDFIVEQLAKKLKIYTSKDVNHFYNLVDAAQKEGKLYTLAAFQGTKLKAGLIGIYSKNELLYLKGAADKEAMKSGAMYALMNELIAEGHSKSLRINFGGSKVESIRFFYQRFNGQDVSYYHYSWDNSPFWFKAMFWLNDLIKGRKKGE